ncbi:hypothetical protein BDY19DRAFT_979153 [Irpex rosettiformis]|uniref:Uncharacterized protein n=1 Tax=Irpex rosettiformis TaxID=378272 RepID=A0ACB8TMW9_9APHY|nr:hypothetical protein BDY19DRAFT_979153 [Irpex rosettiformis]
MRLLKPSKRALLQVDADKLKISCEVSASNFMLAPAHPSLHLRITYRFAHHYHIPHSMP